MTTPERLEYLIAQIGGGAKFNDWTDRQVRALALDLRDERLRAAALERERDEWRDAANDYGALAIRMQKAERERDALRAALERQRNHATLVLAATYDVGMGDESAEKALGECGRLGSTMLKEAQAALATAPDERRKKP